MFRSVLVVSSLWLVSADPTCSKHTNQQGTTLGQENQLLQIQKVHKHKSRGEANIHHAADPTKENGSSDGALLKVPSLQPPTELQPRFVSAWIPADRFFQCLGTRDDPNPNQPINLNTYVPSISCVQNQPNIPDLIMLLILPDDMVNPGSGDQTLSVYQLTSVFPTQTPEPIFTGISWTAVSTEVLHFNGLDGRYRPDGRSNTESMGILIKGNSIPAGPSSDTWNNTHQPNDQEALDWMSDNFETDFSHGMELYQSLGGQMPGQMGLLSWLNTKALVSQPNTAVSKTDFFAAAAEE